MARVTKVALREPGVREVRHYGIPMPTWTGDRSLCLMLLRHPSIGEASLIGSAILSDPQGNPFALWEVDKKAH